MSVLADISISRLDAREAERRLDELADMLVDAVAHGAAVHFLPGVTQEDGRSFWRAQLGGIGSGDRNLYVAERGGRVIGTVMLFLMPQPNQQHRAEIGKMLVHSSARRQGLGRLLLGHAEKEALAAGRTLLMLDTEADGAGHMLYRARGWTEFGRVPSHYMRHDGQLGETSFFYKLLT